MPNPVKHLKTINHFRKRLYLRCLAGFWIQSVRIRSSHPVVLLGKGVLKICSKFTREHPCQSAISIKFASLLKSHFDMGALLYNCCIFSEHLYIWPPLDGCFWRIFISKFVNSQQSKGEICKFQDWLTTVYYTNTGYLC